MLSPSRTLLLAAVAVLFASLLAPLPGSASDANYLVSRDLFYGDDTRPDRDLQSLDIYWQDNLERRPVIIYLHDGAWALGDKEDVHNKPRFFAQHNISFISMNYRLRWEGTLADQLEDVLSVIQWVKKNSKQYGLDSKRIILMGHGAGAHLASLVATQPKYLDRSGVDFSTIRAVVAIETASFDIYSLMTETGSFLDRRRHSLIFGDEEKVWRAASPITHVEKGKAIPAFALMYVPGNESTTSQTRAFARALLDAGTDVIMIPGNERTTDSIDQELGNPTDQPTLALFAFIRAAI